MRSVTKVFSFVDALRDARQGVDQMPVAGSDETELNHTSGLRLQAPGPGRRRHGELEHPVETEHVDHVGGDRHRAGLVDATRAKPAHEAEQHEQEAHAPPRLRNLAVHAGGELADRETVAARAIEQRVDVAHRVDQFLRAGSGGRIASHGDRRPACAHASSTSFARHRIVKADRRAVGAGAQTMTEPLARQRVQRTCDLRVLVGRDLRLSPQRHVVGPRRRRLERSFLDGIEVLAGSRCVVVWRRMPYSSAHQCRPRPRAPSRSSSFSPAKQSSRTSRTVRSVRALSFGCRGRAGSTWKPRACAYSRNSSMMRGLIGSAVCTIALVQSGTTTRNTPS